MAAPLGFLSNYFKKLPSLERLAVLKAQTPLLQQCCGKKKKAGSTTKNKIGHTTTHFKNRGPKYHDGQFVVKGDTLFRQLGMRMYPGENVGLQKNGTLYALREGLVIVSCEKLNPYPDSPLYNRIQNGMEIYKKFYNVYPTPLKAKFKCVSNE